jgi:hypothetical protein
MFKTFSNYLHFSKISRTIRINVAKLKKKTTRGTCPKQKIPNILKSSLFLFEYNVGFLIFSYPTSTRRHGNFAGVHTLLRIILSSNSAVLINIITGVSPPHFDFFVFYVLCQC